MIPALLTTALAGDTATLDLRFTAVSDRVMGGVSDVRAEAEGGAVHLTGDVRVVPGTTGGGFVQIGADLGRLDASAWSGVRIVVRGDGQRYGLHLRTDDVARPWQSYRSTFPTTDAWTEVRIPFEDFQPYRLRAPLDLTSLRRLSVIAVERVGPADVWVREVGLYRD